MSTCVIGSPRGWTHETGHAVVVVTQRAEFQPALESADGETEGLRECSFSRSLGASSTSSSPILIRSFLLLSLRLLSLDSTRPVLLASGYSDRVIYIGLGGNPFPFLIPFRGPMSPAGRDQRNSRSPPLFLPRARRRSASAYAAD